MPNDPFLSLVLYILPYLFVLVVIGVVIRIGIFVLFVFVAIKQAKQFQNQLDAVVRTFPQPGSPPPWHWVQQVNTLATTWHQMPPAQQQRLENRKADMMAAFTSARVPFTPPPGW